MSFNILCCILSFCLPYFSLCLFSWPTSQSFLFLKIATDFDNLALMFLVLDFACSYFKVSTSLEIFPISPSISLAIKYYFNAHSWLSPLCGSPMSIFLLIHLLLKIRSMHEDFDNFVKILCKKYWRYFLALVDINLLPNIAN